MSVWVGMNRMLRVLCLRSKFKRKNGDAIPQKMNEKSLFQCCLIWIHCSSCCWSLFDITFIQIRNQFFIIVGVFFPFDFTLLDCRGSEWTEDMKCNIFSPSVLTFWSKEMLNAYYDFLVINVNIICKDILLYIFVNCFLKANFNNKKKMYIHDTFM